MSPFSSTTPEHLHLFLNRLRVVGYAFAALPLLLGLLARSVPVCQAGMALAFARNGFLRGERRSSRMIHRARRLFRQPGFRVPSLALVRSADLRPARRAASG